MTLSSRRAPPTGVRPARHHTGVGSGATPADLLQHAADLGELIASRARSKSDRRSFARYRDDPVGFARVLGVELWARQVEIAEAVRDRDQVAVMSANGIGKDAVAAVLMLWWVYCRDGLVLLTGPGERTILEVLMRNEVARLFHRAQLWGTLQTAALRFPDDPVADRRGILAMTSSEIAKLSGHHAPRVLVIIEEALGVEAFAWHAMLGCAVGEHDRLLAIGNPDAPEGEFYRVTRPASGWRVIQISALESPNVVAGRTVIPGMITRAGIDRIRQAGGGEASPLYCSRVLGQFPETSVHSLFKRAWLEKAAELYESGALAERSRASRWTVGLDPAGSDDGDETCVVFRRGPLLAHLETWREADTMISAGRVIALLRERHLAPRVEANPLFASAEPDYGPGVTTDAFSIRCDVVGLGKGLADYLARLGWPVTKVHAAGRPRAGRREVHYYNLRAEMYGTLADQLRDGKLAIPRDAKLWEELLATQFELDVASGKLKIEPKEAIRERIGRSPDRADAVAFAFGLPVGSIGGAMVDF